MKVAAIALLWGFVICSSFIGRGSSIPAPGSCPDNEFYDSCGKACQLTCDNWASPPVACMSMCRSGCFCQKGYIRNNAGICVRPEEC